MRDVYVHRGPLPPEDWFVCGGVPVTTAARTIADLLGDECDECPTEDETTVGRYLLRMERNGLDLSLLGAQLDDWVRRNRPRSRDGEFLVQSLRAAAHSQQM